MFSGKKTIAAAAAALLAFGAQKVGLSIEGIDADAVLNTIQVIGLVGAIIGRLVAKKPGPLATQ